MLRIILKVEKSNFGGRTKIERGWEEEVGGLRGAKVKIAGSSANTTANLVRLAGLEREVKIVS